MNEDIVWFASLFSLAGVMVEYIKLLKSGNSIFLKSNLFLPLYAAGILQWFLFGIKMKQWSLISTCCLQLFILAHFLKLFFRARLDQ